MTAIHTEDKPSTTQGGQTISTLLTFAEWKVIMKRITDAGKYQVTVAMFNELHPGLAVTIGAYEDLTETVGTDSTLTIFNEQVKAVKKESKNRSK